MTALPNIWAPAGTTPLTVAGATAVAQAGRTLVTMPDPTPAGPTGTATYLWSWLRQPGSATFSDTAIAQPTVTADAEGEWVALCTVTLAGQTVEFIHTFRIGQATLSDKGQVLAEVIVDLDYKAIGAAAPQDLTSLGNSDYTIGGLTHYCDQTGYDALALGASGIRMYNTAGTGDFAAVTLGLHDDYDIVAGDYVVVQQHWEPTSMSSGSVRCSVQQAEGGSASGAATSLKIDVKRIGAADYDLYKIAGVGGGSKTADLAAALPDDLQLVMAGADHDWHGRADDDASMPADPGDTVSRAAYQVSSTTATRDIASGLYFPWTSLHAAAVCHSGVMDVNLAAQRVLRHRPISQP